ncbi:MAG: radical SAM protein, partial [Candidatus Altiarchaeota archaeon]|nr:radical SAM protein [Candidatus Altiarchaeota archaeon]
MIDILRGSWRILKIKIGYRVPLKVVYYVSYNCNLKCSFCERRTRQSKELTTDQVKKCMREFKGLGTVGWSFSGGEALLREDISDLIKYARKQGFKCNLVSNAWFIPEKIDIVEELDSIVISLDGPKEIHDAIRGKGSYDRVITSLELLKDRKPTVIINTVLNKTNLDSLDEILEIIEKYNCGWEIQPVFCQSKKENDNAIKYFTSQQDISEAINWLQEQKLKGKRILRSDEVLNSIKKTDYHTLPDCYAARAFFILSPDGRLLPCARFLPESAEYPSVLENGVKNAINQLPDMSKCRQCMLCCYLEYNYALHYLVRTGIRYLKNQIRG